MAKASIPRILIATPEGRLSWNHLNQIDAKTPERPYASGKFDAEILIAKTTNIDALKAAVVKTAQTEWPELNITTLGQIKLPFKDGDEKDSEHYKGHIFLSCKTGNKPTVVGPDRAEYAGPLKAGDYVRLSVTAWPFKLNMEREAGQALKAAGKLIVDGRDENGRPQMWRPAVTFLLNAVQFVREGSAFGGTSGVKAFEADPLPVAAADDGLFN